MIFPNCPGALLHAHQDNAGIAGSSESYTVWMPLHDCPQGQGTLEIKEASHLFGLQTTEGYIKPETAPGGDWVGGRINAGDAVMFHSLTVHSSTLSTSDRLRFSVDCRFQSYDEAVSPLEIVFPNQAKGGRTWETTYADWKQDDWKYYWRNVPLRIKPLAGRNDRTGREGGQLRKTASLRKDGGTGCAGDSHAGAVRASQARNKKAGR